MNYQKQKFQRMNFCEIVAKLLKLTIYSTFIKVLSLIKNCFADLILLFNYFNTYQFIGELIYALIQNNKHEDTEIHVKRFMSAKR